ncbi:hypothetical protein PVAP13_9NG406400, partial [Panicum virgatum]
KSLPIEILQDILVRLPAKDAVRSSCVSKLWCRIVRDPSFCKLHGADHVAAPSESEALLVYEKREGDEVSIFNLSPGKAMCQVAIPSGYSLTNVCNGFLCFALDDHAQAPPVVCNPVTGETLQLPEPPDPADARIDLTYCFVLGFSPPTKEYKMFRLSSPRNYKSPEHKTNYIAVYTVGGGGGWRQSSYLSRFCSSLSLPPPVHINGNLYVPANQQEDPRVTRMLVLNVATETSRTYSLPYNYNKGYHPAWPEMLANGFELNGQMCLAVNVIYPRRKLEFWVMAPPGELAEKSDDDNELYWDLHYCFDMEREPFFFNRARGAWLDHDQMLCYRHGESLYKHDTRGYSSSSSSSHDGSPLLSFDLQLELPKAPSQQYSSHLSFIPSYSCRWNICGGYRPSLLSPVI